MVRGALRSDISESLSDNVVGGDRDALLADLSESTLVDKLLDGGTGWVSVGYVRLDQSEHADGGLVQSNEGSVVELTKAEELHDLLGLGGNSDNTADSDNQSNLGLGRDVESTVGLGLAASVGRRPYTFFYTKYCTYQCCHCHCCRCHIKDNWIIITSWPSH